MWALLAAIALILAGGAAQAQSSDKNESGLQSCFRATRAAIAVCSEQSNNPEQRVDCLAKARADQLECINQALSTAGNKPPENSSKTARSAPAASGAAMEAPDALKEPAPADSVGSVPADDATAIERPDRTVEPAPNRCRRTSFHRWLQSRAERYDRIAHLSRPWNRCRRTRL